MKSNRIRRHLPSREESRLQELHRWLTIGGSSIAASPFALFIPFGIVFMFMKWGMIVFTPYMIWRLYQCRRYSWIVWFFIVVGIPGIMMLSRKEPGFSDISGLIVYMLPMITFYAYTWILRHSVGEWLEDLRWKRQAGAQEIDQGF